jgi:TetR/AcrR family transcriptional repressor of nem operon
MVNSAVELAAHDPEVRRRAEASRGQLVRLFRQAILQGQQHGEISARHNADALAEFLTNSLFGLRLTAKLVADRDILLKVVETTLRALD